MRLFGSFLCWLAVSFLCGLPVAGCSNDASDEPDAMQPDAAAPDAAACPEGTTFFVNSFGESFTPGPTDPATNTTSLISAPATVAPVDLSSTEWEGIMSCVRELVADYNLIITETDPSPADHHELVVTADSSMAILSSGGILGISEFSCEEFTNLSFTFNATNGGIPHRVICEDMVTNILRTAHVDTLFSCPTLPTFLTGCGDKTIVDEEASCGDLEVRACACGGDTINPHQAMLDRFGAACP